MPVNEGVVDRVIRVILGIVIIVILAVFLPGENKWWAVLGLVPLITGITGFCGLYTLLGIKTCNVKSSR
jgi:predicted RND superfamily exporter protein